MNHVNKYHDLHGSMHSIHPNVRFGKDVFIGRNVIIEDGCQIGDNTRICNQSVLRSHCKIGSGCLISHLCLLEEHVVMGNWVSINAQSHITTSTIFEDMVFVGVMCIFLNTQKIKHGREYPLIKEPPYVEYGARIASASIIMPGVRIGTQAFIAAGSLVTKSCEPFFFYMGRPAKKVRPVSQDERLQPSIPI